MKYSTGFRDVDRFGGFCVLAVNFIDEGIAKYGTGKAIAHWCVFFVDAR